MNDQFDCEIDALDGPKYLLPVDAWEVDPNGPWKISTLDDPKYS